MQHITNIEKAEELVEKSKKNAEVTNIKEYKRKLLNKKIEESLIKSEEDIKNGRVVEASKVFEEWEQKYGI